MSKLIGNGDDEALVAGNRPSVGAGMVRIYVDVDVSKYGGVEHAVEAIRKLYGVSSAGVDVVSCVVVVDAHKGKT